MTQLETISFIQGSDAECVPPLFPHLIVSCWWLPGMTNIPPFPPGLSNVIALTKDADKRAFFYNSNRKLFPSPVLQKFLL